MTTTTTELWKRTTQDTRYEISNLGRVRRGQRILRDWPVTGGYREIRLGRKHRAKVAHLVALAFIGPRPPGHGTNHIDFNPSNNAATNLEWKTQKDNNAWSRRAGRMPPPCLQGEAHGRAVLTWKTVARLRELASRGWTNEALARTFGIGTSQVSRIRRGKQWVA